MTNTDRACRWCGEPLVRRADERPSAYTRRTHCSRSCQVATQNRTRARRAARRG